MERLRRSESGNVWEAETKQYLMSGSSFQGIMVLIYKGKESRSNSKLKLPRHHSPIRSLFMHVILARIKPTLVALIEWVHRQNLDSLQLWPSVDANLGG